MGEADANGCYADATNAIADNTTIYCPEPSGSTDCSTFWPDEISWTLKCVDSSGSTTADINDGKCGCLSERTTNIDAALQSSCTLTMKDTYGDGWNGHSLRLVNFDAPTTLSLCTDVSYYFEGACVDADGGITLQNGGKDADVVVTWTLLSSSQMLVYRTGTTEAGADCYYDTNLVGTGEGLASDADVDGGVIAWRQDATAANTFFTGAFSVCPPPSPPPPSPSAPPPPPLSPGESYEYSVEYQVEVEGAIGDFDEDTYTTNLAALLSPQSEQVRHCDYVLGLGLYRILQLQAAAEPVLLCDPKNQNHHPQPGREHFRQARWPTSRSSQDISLEFDYCSVCAAIRRGQSS